MATDIKPFATDVGSSITPQSEYNAATWRTSGFPSGTLPRTRLNKVLRQSAFVAAALAEALSTILNQDVLDDGNSVGLRDKFLTALSARLPFDINATYPEGSIGFVLKGFATGAGFGLSADQLRAILAGSLTANELSNSLLNRINLIDAPTTGLVTRVDQLENDYATVGDLATALAQAQAASTSAQQRANEAAVSAGAAFTSETNAANSATAASTSASNAAIKATESATSATSAAGSASSASSSATAAANSASTASGAASAAAGHASAAATSATAAGSSATAANTSRVAAETAQSAASTSASNAASSATSASNSAASAITSRDQAVSASTTAQNAATAASGYLSTVQASADAAAQSATAANQSKLDAATSASSAQTFRNEAVSSATTATNAVASAQAAQVSAAQSATNAGNSASAAAGSATSAATSATNASQSASAAATARTAAETAQSAASTSATNAATSATNAAGSASSATSAATTASQAATSAGASATAANTSASSASTSALNANSSAAAAANWYNQTVAATGDLSAAVTQQAATVATFDGRISNVEANYVLKVSATRSDGKKVFAFVGLAATGSGDTGESQILLSADQLRFVPASNINADPKQMFIIGTVNGVTTLVVAAAAIGDSTVTNQKIGRFIASDDFNGVIDAGGNITDYGTTGWALAKGGQIVATTGRFRGTVTAQAVVELGAVSTVHPVSNFSGVVTPSGGTASLGQFLGTVNLTKAASRVAVEGMCRVQIRLNPSFGGRPEAMYPLNLFVQLIITDASNNVLQAFPFWNEVRRHWMAGSDQIALNMPMSGLSGVASVGLQTIKLLLNVQAQITNFSQPIGGSPETALMQDMSVQTAGVAVIELKG